MNDNIRTILGNSNQTSRDDAIEKLFAHLREDEPQLVDSNFTKVVVNTLPSKLSRAKKRSMMFDLLGLLCGLVGVYWFFDGAQIVQTSLQFIPESLSITVGDVVTFFIAAICMACLGWWTAEKAIS